MKNKVVIVTGAGSGIGRAAALRLASEGAKVLVTNRSVKRGEKTFSEILRAGGEASFLQVDVADGDSVKAMASEANFPSSAEVLVMVVLTKLPETLVV